MTTWHTPGPWRVEVDNHGTIAVMWSHGYVVDDVACGEVGEPRSMADAHLIAAAPDMLEALEECVEAFAALGIDATLPVLHARAAIAKSKGTP